MLPPPAILCAGKHLGSERVARRRNAAALHVRQDVPGERGHLLASAAVQHRVEPHESLLELKAAY